MWTVTVIAVALVWLLFVVCVLIDDYRHRDAVAMRRYERQRRHFEKYFE